MRDLGEFFHFLLSILNLVAYIPANHHKIIKGYSICNYCSCCCGQSGNPTVNASYYFAQVNQDLCVGCGTCVEKCYNGSLQLNEDGKAERIGEYCIGCGVCAYFCPENAISLVEDERIVRILPPRPT